MMLRSLRILHVLAPAPYGGLESVVEMLARGLHVRGLEVHVAAIAHGSDPDHPLAERLSGTGLEVHQLRVPLRGYLKERAGVARILDDVKADILHSHGPRVDVVDAPAARAAGIPIVTTVHGFTAATLRIRFQEWLARRRARGFDAVVAVSEDLAAILREAGVPPDRVHVIPNAWSPPPDGLLPRDRARSLLTASGPEPLVGWVGRLSPEKDPGLMIEALARAPLTGVRACFVGDGPMAPRVLDRAEELGVAGRVIMAGRVQGAYRCMAAFDVLALSSRREGTPMVVLEATAAGVPVVAPDVGEVRRMLGGGFNVVPPGDPDALARALERTLASPELAADTVARAQRSVAEHHGMDAWLERHIRIYRDLAGADPEPAP